MAVTVRAVTSAAVSTSRSPSVGTGTYQARAGEMVLFYCNNTAATGAITVPTGWVNCHPSGGNNVVASDSNTCCAVYHIVTSAEESAGTTTWTATNLWNANTTGNVLALVLRGFDQTTPIDSSATGFSSANSATPHVLPALTGTDLSTGSTVVGFIGKDGTGTWTTPTGWTAQGSNNTNQGTTAFTSNTATTAGTNVAATNVTPSGGDEYVAYAIAFNRAARAKLDTFVDDFAVADTTEWDFSGPSSSVAQGQLSLPCTASTSGNQVLSIDSYDLTGSSLMVELAQVLNYGTGTTAFSVGVRNAVDIFDMEQFQWNQGKMQSRELVDNTADSSSLYTFWNPARPPYRYLRIREASGTIYWEFSNDATNWDVQRSKVMSTAIDMTDVQVLIRCSYSGTEPDPGTLLISGLNNYPAEAVPPDQYVAAPEFVDEFTTLDTAKWTPDANVTVSGGVAHFPFGGAGSVWQGMRIVGIFSLVDNAVAMKATPASGTSADTYYALTFQVDLASDSSAFIRINVIQSASGNFAVESQEATTGGSQVHVSSTGYNSATMKWFRIRHDSGRNLFYTEYSSDGAAWTLLDSWTPTIAITSMSLNTFGGGGSGGVPATEATVDRVVIGNYTVNGSETATLTDTFATLDTNKWTVRNADTTVSVSGGQLVIPCTVGAPNITSVKFYDLTNSYTSVMLATGPPATGQGFLRVSRSNNGWLQIGVAGSTVYCQENYRGTQDSTTLAYSATTHKYLRIREAAGTIYWDTSADAVTWTNRKSKASSVAVSRVQMQIFAYTGDAVSPGNTVWDDFNITAATSALPMTLPAKLIAAITGFTGTIAATVARVSAALLGSQPHSGTIAATTVKTAAAMAGTHAQTGTIAAATRPLMAALSGAQTQTGTIAAVTRVLSAALTGEQVQAGTIAAATRTLSAALLGVMVPSGTVASTLLPVSAALSGTFTETETGTLASTLRPVSAALAGTHEQTGTMAAALRTLQASLSGTHEQSGTMAAALGTLSASLSGTHEQSGTVAAALGVLQASLTGTHEQSGTIAATLAKLTAELAGEQVYAGTITATLGVLAAALTSEQAQIGTIEAALGVVAAAIQGDQVGGESVIDTVLQPIQSLLFIEQAQIGEMAATLHRVSAALSGAQVFSGTIEATTAKVTAEILGSQGTGGVIDTTILAPTAALTGEQVLTGTIDTTLEATTASINADVFANVIAATLQPVSAQMAGTHQQSGMITVLLTPASAHLIGAMLPVGQIAADLLPVHAQMLGVVTVSEYSTTRALFVRAANRVLTVLDSNRATAVAAVIRALGIPAETREVVWGAEDRSAVQPDADRSTATIQERREVVIGAENRTLNVGAPDRRELRVAAENRALVVPAEDRAVVWPADMLLPVGP